MGVELICCFIPDENLFVLCCTRPTSLVHFGTIGIFTPSWLSEECSLTQYIVIIFPRHCSDRTIELFSESLVVNFWKTRAIQRTNNAVHFEFHFDTYLMRKSGSNSATYEKHCTACVSKSIGFCSSMTVLAMIYNQVNPVMTCAVYR